VLFRSKVLAQPLDQRLALDKLAAVRQRCIDANLALPKRYILFKWELQVKSTSFFL
jgi:hypothetical protein